MRNEKKNPLAWSKSAEFLCAYSWEGKAHKQIIDEMKLPEYEQKYLEDAMQELAPQGKFTGMDLDEYFVLRMAMDEEDIGPLDDEDTLYMN